MFVFWMMLMEPVDAPARWWPFACLTCVSGLRRLEKKFNFLRCIHVFDLLLKNRSDITWRKLVTASLLLHCISGYSCLRYRNEFFSAVFQVLDWSLLVLHFDGRVCNWIPKVIWPRKDWLWGFLLKMAYFVDFVSVWTEICRNCSIVILFWRHQFFSMFRLRGILVCSLKMLVLLAIGFCNIDW